MPPERSGATTATPAPDGGPLPDPKADQGPLGPTLPRRGPAPPLFGIVVLAAIVVVAAGLRQVSSLVGPTFLVITLVITVHPVRSWLVRRRCPQALASLVAMLAVYALVLMVLGSVVWSLTELVNVLPDYADEFTALFTTALQRLAEVGLGVDVLQRAADGVSLSSFQGVAQALLNTLSSGLSLLALIAAVVVFVALDAAGIGDRLRLIGRERPEVAAALVEFAGSVRKYWIVTTIFGLIVAAIDVVALLIIGVPLAFTWGVLAFVTNYIPNIGFLLGLVPPTLIALLDGGPSAALAVIVSYTVINVVIQTLIQPRFTGDAVGITGTVAFLSLIFWASLLGALGALLAVPATLLVKSVLVDHNAAGRWVGPLINSTPAGADDDRPGIGRWAPGPDRDDGARAPAS